MERWLYGIWDSLYAPSIMKYLIGTFNNFLGSGLLSRTYVSGQSSQAAYILLQLDTLKDKLKELREKDSKN